MGYDQCGETLPVLYCVFPLVRGYSERDAIKTQQLYKVMLEHTLTVSRKAITFTQSYDWKF